MIVVLTEHGEPVLTDLDRLDRLHAEVHGPPDAVRLGRLCRADDDDHVWVDIVAARAIGSATDETFGQRFDEMIEFAAGKGWLDHAGTHVRAHVERSD